MFHRCSAAVRGVWRLEAIPYLGALLVALALVSFAQFAQSPASATPASRPDVFALKNGYAPLSRAQAREVNAQLPVTASFISSAQPFNLSAVGGVDRARALECLTAAIYYEAGIEARDGQRAVAQVVINRLRHPAYPKSVCGVVYQGSARATGCQFTFTCDGSLSRAPSPAVWRRSREVAAAALAGSVYGGVGHATHYHADWVVPYWSSSLDRVAKIGAHIFYQIGGPAGRPGAFTAAYAGFEPAFSRAGLNIGVPSDGVVELETQSQRAVATALPLPPEDKAEELDEFGLLDFRTEAASGSMAGSVKSLDAALAPARSSQ